MTGSTVIPTVRYRDANAAIDWLVEVFGFHRHAVYHGPDNTVEHAELTLGGGMLMIGSATTKRPYPEHIAHPGETGGRVTSPLYLVVPNCEPVYAAAKAHGAVILQELREMSYGGKAFTVCDLEGYVGAVGEYDPWKVSAEEVTSPE